MNARRKLFFFGKGGAPAPVGLLNTTEGAGAAFAISLRMLNADLIGQDAIEVKRVANSDFDRFSLTADGVPLSDIASFCGASDGIVSWMLDQSGNGFHATQTAEASTAFIYRDGAITSKNGKAVLDFRGGQFYNVITENITTGQFFTVFEARQVGLRRRLYDSESGGRWTRRLTGQDDSFGGIFAGQFLSFPVDVNTFLQETHTYNTSSSAAFQNGVSVASGDPGSNSLGTLLRIGTREGATADFFDGVLGELILFPTIKGSGDQETVEQNQIDYYAVS